MNPAETNDPAPLLVAALTAGRHTPSSRFRLRQYVPALASHGIQVREHIPFFHKNCGLPSPFKLASRVPALWRCRDADLVWQGKELVQGYPTLERWLPRPRILDVDDAIWLNPPLGRLAAPRIARQMDAIVAGNEFLADYFRRFCPVVHVVPTAIDVHRYHPAAPPSDRFVIGWTGLPSNYKYLRPILPALDRFFNEHRDARLMLVSSRPWKNSGLDPDRIRFVPWSPENEAAILNEITVGIMPLPDTDWARGKCSFKMLQYMAAARPVIVSPVGMNRDVLAQGRIGLPARTTEEWFDAFEQLYRDRDLASRMGATGRKIVEDVYAAEKIAQQLAEIFRNTVAATRGR